MGKWLCVLLVVASSACGGRGRDGSGDGDADADADAPSLEECEDGLAAGQAAVDRVCFHDRGEAWDFADVSFFCHSYCVDGSTDACLTPTDWSENWHCPSGCAEFDATGAACEDVFESQ